VQLATQFAMANENITSDVVEANEFMDLANSYEVYGVPKIVIRGSEKSAEFEGAQPEHIFLQNILKVI
jgi:predicted DsbA family dithiol-disulfide isomerase